MREHKEDAEWKYQAEEGERERERCDERDLRERDMGGRREKAVGSQESRLEGKTRRRESALAYFISVKPIYIELKLRERADKVRRTGENRQRERGGVEAMQRLIPLLLQWFSVRADRAVT